MEPTGATMKRKETRAILPLLKARVTKIEQRSFTMSFGPDYGSPTTIRVSCQTNHYDLRDGDLLTLYTEVLLRGSNEA